MKNEEINLPQTKVVDSDGNPLLMYHGGDSFNDSYGGVTWFTSEKTDAAMYAKNNYGTVTSAYLNIKNPLYSGHIEHLKIKPSNDILKSTKKRNIGSSIIIKNGIITFIETNDAVLIAQDIGKDGVIDIENGKILDVIIFNNKQIVLNKKNMKKKIKKQETKEAMGASSAGAFSGPIEITKQETKEATTTASSGQYSTPQMWAKNKKNWRGAAKPMFPGGKFVSVKNKCKTFPYCNKGDINALNLWEDDIVKEAIMTVATKTKKTITEVVNIMLNENHDQQELDQVGRFVKKSTEDYDDWEWDGKVLTIFVGEDVEKYTRKELEDEGILDHTVKEATDIIKKKFYKSPINDILSTKKTKMNKPIGKLNTMVKEDNVPFDENQKITDSLSSIDELIDLQTKKLELLKQHKKGLMQKLSSTKLETKPNK